MNERIKELALQARKALATDALGGGKFDMQAYEEKFAELIVRDGINVIRQEWFNENNTVPDQDTRSIAIHVGKKLGIDASLNAVTKHFGVEYE